jgi:biopolymer transport protein ExbB/TolQ
MNAGLQNIWAYLIKGGWMMGPLLVLGAILFATLLRAVLFQLFHVKAGSEDEAAFERRLRYLKVLTSVAPLMGLLGTVAGMLKTFRGLASKGISFTENLVAVGISEALVTTQTGLAIGVVGLTGIMLHEYRIESNRLKQFHAGGAQ